MRRANVNLWALVLSILIHETASSDQYVYSTRGYRYTDDLFAAVWQEFHLREPPAPDTATAVVANWEDIKEMCQTDSEACSRLADLVTLRPAMLFNGNEGLCSFREYSGHYFVARSASQPPRGYFAVDYIEPQALWLVCGLGIYGEHGTYPILVHVPAETRPTGLVSPDLTLYIGALELYGPSRRRTIGARLEFHGFDQDGGLLWKLRETRDVQQDATDADARY